MYKVYFAHDDGTVVLVHDDTSPRPDRRLLAGVIVEELNRVPTFTMTIPPSNRGFMAYDIYRTAVIVERDGGGTVFEGRIVEPSPEVSAGGSVKDTVVAEGLAGYLHDSIQTYRGLHTYGSLEEWLEIALNNHNSMVPAEKHIHAGNLTVETPEGGLWAEFNYKDSFDFFYDYLTDKGWEFQIRRGNGDLLYIDIVPRIGSDTASSFDAGRNIVEYVRRDNPTGIITRLIPIGAPLEDSGDNVTIAPVNGGCMWIDSDELIAKYGIITGKHVWDQVVNPETLYRHGVEWLAANNRIRQTIRLQALDLSLIGMDTDPPRLGDGYRIRHPLLGTDGAMLRIIKLRRDVVNPTLSSADFGDRNISAAEYSIRSRSGLQDAQDTGARALRQASDALGQIPAVYTEIEESGTRLLQSANELMQYVYDSSLRASEFQSFIQEYSTQLVQTSRSIEFTFAQLTSMIDTVDGNYSSQFSELHRYIRFIDGSIQLGQIGNDLMTEITNGAIYFKQNGMVLSYYANGRMYIANGTITESLRFGGQWVLRLTGDGDLYVAWTGGS